MTDLEALITVRIPCGGFPLSAKYPPFSTINKWVPVLSVNGFEAVIPDPIFKTVVIDLRCHSTRIKPVEQAKLK